jgi:hypothetical protein
MSYQDLVLGFNKGFGRSVTPFKADTDTAYELMNLRIARAERGRLEQTPYFNDNTYTAGTYWNGSASTTEAATSAIYDGWFNRHTNTQSLFSGFTLRDNGTQVPIYYQTASASGDDVHKGVLLVLTTPTALALGQTYDVEIDAVATFKWQKNGGGYTTGVPIVTTGVSIDGGNAIVYFLASAAFTITDHWTWQRTDCTISPVNAATGIPGNTSYISTCGYGKYLVWISHDNRIMIYDPVVGYARSIGYQPICGYFIKIFYDHLFVGDSTISTSAIVYSGETRNSDLTDIDVFISTDVNEADIHTFNDILEGEAGVTAANLQQIFVVSNRIFVMTGQKVYASAYLGLPTVFSFEEVTTFAFITFGINRPRVMTTTGGVYLVQRDGVWFTDGITYSHIGLPQGILDSTSNLFLAVDFFHRELVMFDVTNKIVYTYQEQYKTWSRRSVSFTNSAGSIFYTGASAKLTLGANSLHYYTEDTAFTGTPVKDSSTGAAFTLPSVISQLIGYGNICQVKEVEGSSLLARAATVAGLNAAYLQTSHIIITLYWGDSVDGTVAPTTTDANAFWTAAKGLVNLTYPRFSARAPSFRLDVTTDNTAKPPAGVSIIQYQPHISIPTPVPIK